MGGLEFKDRTRLTSNDSSMIFDRLYGSERSQRLLLRRGKHAKLAQDFERHGRANPGAMRQVEGGARGVPIGNL